MACLGGDGVILHASNLFRNAVPPVVSFNLGSLGLLTSHSVSSKAQSVKIVDLTLNVQERRFYFLLIGVSSLLLISFF